MSEVKFTPRVFANEDIEDGIDFFEWSLSDTEGPQYLSLQEHNHLLSQLEERLVTAEYDREAMASLWSEGKKRLEERLRVAESYFKIIDDHTAEYSGVAGNQVLFETVKAALAAIKEKQ